MEWWSSWGMEFFLRRGQGGWWLDATDITTPEGKDPIRKRAMALHFSQAHTYTAQRNTVFKKYLPVLPTLPRDPDTGTKFQPEQKEYPQCLSVMAFLCFLMGPCQRLNAMGSLSYCGTTVSLCLSLSCSYFSFSVPYILSFFLAGRLLLN